MALPLSRPLTRKASGIMHVLPLPIRVSPPLPDPNVPPRDIRDCSGIWDTGATGSVITQQVVDDLGLKPIGVALVHTANETVQRDVYLVTFWLPNKVVVHGIRATLGTVPSADVLIGMDVVSLGDFAVTNFNGKTVVSFRIPSGAEIDFVEDARSARNASAATPSRYERRHPGKAKRKKKRPKY